ncbi:class I SAM-dependent methyltransferase [Agromyces sp. CFH 90414]|uniref:Class I SAM-dependent methyltransferase n=1 Tax=Agromyces agglutinans TaxID=2662258 RepID=A0A6I2F9U5_9MICO|nr:class I SAM-dependent methyltransferase [Agromyces agglutinans]MRG60547.1 class I SAM-dependent methyltransferase [Agromyces agglutinans]
MSTSLDRDVRTAAPPFWLSPTAYWQPERIVTSAWLGHAPFAFWLMDALRPRGVVELGTHYGFSCFVFAQAAKRLGSTTAIRALDSWEGDDQAGFYGEEVYASVADVAQREYPELVTLMRGWFSETRTLVADDSVDLLHIDGRHSYDDVSEDYEQWRSTVRDGGVILFHDIAETENGFGVWRLWEELSTKYPSFAFAHSHGLGVLSVGEPRSGAIADLFAADDETAAAIRRDFEELGRRIERLAWLEAKPAEVDSLHEVVAMLQGRTADLEHKIAERDREVAEIRSSTSWRVTRPLRSLGTRLQRRG